MPRTTGNLETDRLILRPFAEADAQARLAYQSMPEVAHYLYRPPLDGGSVLRGIRQNPSRTLREDNDKLLFAVVDKDSGRLLGEVVATLANAAARQIEVGWIFDPAMSGRGFATEAAAALLEEVFGPLGAHRAFARVDADNAASSRLCERLGMRLEGHFIENDLDGDRWGSELVYALLQREHSRLSEANGAGTGAAVLRSGALIEDEQVLDAALESGGEPESNGKRRVVPAFLDRDDRLA